MDLEVAKCGMQPGSVFTRCEICSLHICIERYCFVLSLLVIKATVRSKKCPTYTGRWYLRCSVVSRYIYTIGQFVLAFPVSGRIDDRPHRVMKDVRLRQQNRDLKSA